MSQIIDKEYNKRGELSADNGSEDAKLSNHQSQGNQIQIETSVKEFNEVDNIAQKRKKVFTIRTSTKEFHPLQLQRNQSGSIYARSRHSSQLAVGRPLKYSNFVPNDASSEDTFKRMEKKRQMRSRNRERTIGRQEK